MKRGFGLERGRIFIITGNAYVQLSLPKFKEPAIYYSTKYSEAMIIQWGYNNGIIKHPCILSILYIVYKKHFNWAVNKTEYFLSKYLAFHCMLDWFTMINLSSYSPMDHNCSIKVLQVLIKSKPWTVWNHNTVFHIASLPSTHIQLQTLTICLDLIWNQSAAHEIKRSLNSDFHVNWTDIDVLL